MDLFADADPNDVDSHEHELRHAVHYIFTSPGLRTSVFKDRHVDLSTPCDLRSSHRKWSPLLHSAPTFRHIRKAYANTLDPNWPRYALMVQGRWFLVGKPVALPSGDLFERGTRGYVALDWSAQRLVFLKDAWRYHEDKFQHEGIVLRTLNDQEVANVPTLVCFEHLPGPLQTTESYKHAPYKQNVLRQIHARSVVEEVCLPMDDFKCGR